MLIAIAAHFLLALALPFVARRWGRWAFAGGAAVPAGTLAFVLTGAEGALSGQPATESVDWAPAIGLEITFRVDALALLMALLVCGVGALVLLYYTFYAKPGSGEIGRNSALLVAFAGAMLGLVLADDVFSLYIFWELTTICSFLLVGGNGVARKARRSATQALLVTSLGGLAMLLGLILLAVQAGTYRISEIIAAPPSGAVAGVAVVLVLVGAFTKSAQVPFHPWLPAAMVAPTPVSAYLHAAAMVKAGVYLIARFAPGFADLPVWWVPVVVVGLWTMLNGGWRALREHDLKTLLAFGTVSQLGFLTVLVGTGSYLAAIAGATMVLAHGLFKSALFLTVGVIDKRTGTRDIRELSGLGKQWPVLAGCALLAVASMAGVPPLLGFIGKEAALETFLGGGARGAFVLVGIVAGSILTVAYSLRFFRGAFGTRAGTAPVSATKPGVLALPVAVPALAGLVLAIGAGLLELLVTAQAEPYRLGEDAGESYELALWHGFTLPLLFSAVILAGGYALYRGRAIVAVLSGWLPPALHAQTGYRATVGALDTAARVLTARLQVGSLPVYIGVILLTMVLVPGTGLLTAFAWPEGSVRWLDEWLQLPLALLCIVAAATVVLARRRLTAVLLTGVIGYAIGALFLIEGAVDLALAQFLVESLTLVVFVLVLRRFPERFVQAEPQVRKQRWPKAIVATVGGVFVATLALIFSGVRHGLPEASRWYIANAQDEAGATNVVNAIIVDFRAFDTVGEIVVLAVAATGAASLILAAHRARRAPARASRVEHSALEQKDALP